jgi:hypothetical protein
LWVEETATLRQTQWDCKYHVVFIPQYRRQTLYKELRSHLGDVLRALAQQKECHVEDGHVLPDPHGADVYGAAQKRHGAALVGSWVCCVHGRPRGEHEPRVYRKQDVEDKRLDQMELWSSLPEGGSHGTALSGSPHKPLEAVSRRIPL